MSIPFKWIAAVLLFANIAIYLWSGGGGDDPQAGSAEPGVNRESMLLLGEAGEDDPADSAGAADGAVGQAGNPQGGHPASAGLSCYRIGPFTRASSRESAARWMADRQLAYRAVRGESREIRAVRVYLGPFDSPAAARPVENRLRREEIAHFLDTGEQGEVHISLGYFTQAELAAKFTAHLQSQGIAARSRVEYRVIGPFDWMEAAVDPARRGLLLSHAWPEDAVAALEIDCRELPGAGETDG